MTYRPQGSGGSQMKKSSRFYFQDLFIRVEDTLFKINRQDFEQGSEVFRNMFDLPKAGESEEGSSTEHPLVLEGIRAVDLENFLAIMYARYPTSEPAPTDLLSRDQWKAAFKLARMWDFEDIRAQALSALKEHTKDRGGIDTILLYQELNLSVDEDFVVAVRSAVERQEEISDEEAEKLGLRTVVRLCTLRGWYSAVRASAAMNQLPNKICAAWGVPLIWPSHVSKRRVVL